MAGKGRGILTGLCVKTKHGSAVPDPYRVLGPLGPAQSQVAEWRIRAGLSTRELLAQVHAAGYRELTFTNLSGLQTGRVLPIEPEWRALTRALKCQLRDLWPNPHALTLIHPTPTRTPAAPPTLLKVATG